MYAIETREIVRVFRTKNKEIVALNNVSLKINKGEIFGLLGANGAGKTTLIKILTTLLLPTSGEGYVYGYDVVNEADEVRKIINLVSGGETPGYGILTVKENLWFFSQLYGIARPYEVINKLIEDMGLKGYEDTRMHKLSTGYKQRLNIARGFINNPKVLFLDEPTLGLDVLSAKHIRRYLREWINKDKDRTILLTTHYINEAEEICDRVAIISNGTIVACNTPAELKRSLLKSTSTLIEIKDVDHTFSLESNEGISVAIEHVDGITKLKVLHEDRESISRLISEINRKGYDILSIKVREPTLEDVYIKYVGKGPDVNS